MPDALEGAGHELGLDHYDCIYYGQYQVMAPGYFEPPSSRSGDSTACGTSAAGSGWVGGAVTAATPTTNATGPGDCPSQVVNQADTWARYRAGA